MPLSQAEQAYEAVKKDILICALPPGSLIVQPQLAERYNTGITPLREALQKLAKEGLVQSIPRFGYVVTPITLADVQELFEMRLVLETEAARMAAERVTPEQIEKLQRLAEFTYVYQDRETYLQYLLVNAEFHLAVAKVTGNRWMAEISAQLMDALLRVFTLGMDVRDNAEEMRVEHRELVEALRKKDPDEAERIVRKQINRSKQRVMEVLLSAIGAPESLGHTIQVAQMRKRK